MNHKQIIFTILILCCLNSYLWRQTTYYVDNQNANANDDNTGTASQPFQTITKAIRTSNVGDIILISEGVYREKLN